MAGKILITPNTGSTTADPTIVYQGSGSTTEITQRVTSLGAVQFEGQGGVLLALSNTPTGSVTIGTATGDVIISGNLTVNGTTTTVNATTLSVADLNITVGSGATSAATANGAGLTIGNYAGNPTLLYGSVNDNFTFNRRVDATAFYGPLTGDVTGNVSGTAGSITGTYGGTLTSTQIINALGYTPSSGAGTVTAVSVTTANGISGSVTATSTPAITLTLGAITPASVAAVGTVTGSNLTGTNTGDQTFYDTFTGGVASPGPLTFPSLQVRGFDAYSSTDFPSNYFTGLTITGSGVRSGQLAMNWNSEEAAPTGLYFRTNDDTTTTSAWSAWQQIVVNTGSWNITAATANALTTTNDYRVNSLGVGTPASGVTGEIRAAYDITAYYSDDQLKTRLGYIENAVEKVRTLDAFYYEANETAQALGYVAKREVGLSAQQVQKIMPEITPPAPIDDKYLTIKYERMIPLLVAAIKEMSDTNDQLRAEIEALKGMK